MLNPLDKILNKSNKRLEDLSNEEIDFYNNAYKAVNQAPPTIPEQVDLLEDQIESLVIKLCEIRTEDKEDTYYKAKLSNMMLLKNSLTIGKKAEKYFKKLSERT